MNKLEDSVIRYQIDLERYESGQADEILALFDNANKVLSDYIKKTTDIATKKRYRKIAQKLNEVSKTLKEQVGEKLDLDGIIDYELKKQKRVLGFAKEYIQLKGNGTVNFLYPTVEQVKTSALFKPPTEGVTYDSYLDGIQNGLYNTWDSALRTGYLTGMPTKDIVKNVLGSVSQETKLKNPGLINGLRNSVYSNTRTLLQSFANETRNRVYEKNEQYFGDYDRSGNFYRYEYLATLDSRTCLVCGADDGKLFNDLHDDKTPQLPRHRGCRCILIPYFNIDGDKRASKNGYVDKITFNEWLGTQKESVQKDVLGSARFAAYKKDSSVITSYVDNGKKLTLTQLLDRGIIDASGGIMEKPLEEQEKFAAKYYASIENRKSKSDISKIAKNTGFSEDKIAEVRSHIFEEDSHLLSNNQRVKFSPNARMALAWQRLEQNKYNDSDIMLLNHEYVEAEFMKKKSYCYEKAHLLANLRYPWEYIVAPDNYKDISTGRRMTYADFHKKCYEWLTNYL